MYRVRAPPPGARYHLSHRRTTSARFIASRVLRRLRACESSSTRFSRKGAASATTPTRRGLLSTSACSSPKTRHVETGRSDRPDFPAVEFEILAYDRMVFPEAWVDWEFRRGRALTNLRAIGSFRT